MKKFMTAVLFVAVAILVSGCHTNTRDDAKALEAIEIFQDSNYEYTMTIQGVDQNTDVETACTYEGKIIAEPYQGDEKLVSGESILLEWYTYEKDGVVYGDMKIGGMGDGSEQWVIGNRCDKRNSSYVRDDFEFSYDRKDTINKTVVQVYKTSYKAPVIYGDSDNTMQLESEIQLEYFLDSKDWKVVRIVVDNKEFMKTQEVARMMSEEGKTQSQAEEEAEQSEIPESKVLVDVKNIGGDIEIVAPTEQDETVN